MVIKKINHHLEVVINFFNHHLFLKNTYMFFLKNTPLFLGALCPSPGPRLIPRQNTAKPAQPSQADPGLRLARKDFSREAPAELL